MTGSPADQQVQDHAASPLVLWSVRRPPPVQVFALALVLGAIASAIGAVFAHMLMLRPDWRVAIALGVGLGAVLVLSLRRHAHVTVDAAGMLTYGIGGSTNVRVDLRRTAGWRQVVNGTLQGIGAEVAVVDVELLNRKGPSPRRMHDLAATLGTALVLEYLTSDDLVAVQALHRRFACGT